MQLTSLLAMLPNMSLSGFTAHPNLVRSRSPTLAALNRHIVTTCNGPLGTLTLLRSENASPQTPPTALLTLLQLVEPEPSPGLHHRPVLFRAAFTTQLQELHFEFNGEEHVVPVAALPPQLTALFCIDTLLLRNAGPSAGQGTGTAATAARAVGSSGQGGVWEGLPQLQILEVDYELDTGMFVGGGGLADLLQGTPNLKRLVCPAEFRQGRAQDAARLRGCAQMLTHLRLDSAFHAVEDPAAEAEQLCEWVGSLRHLRQLHLWRDDIPPALFAQVSYLVPLACAVPADRWQQQGMPGPVDARSWALPIPWRGRCQPGDVDALQLQLCSLLALPARMLAPMHRYFAHCGLESQA
jgi:hypothetical protein